MPDFLFIVFGVFATILLASSLGVIFARNPVHASLFLVLAFVSSAGLWMTLQAEFLALAIILVYVGAVMVLFLFVIMMLDINLDVLREGFWRYLPLAACAAALVVGEIIFVLYSEPFFDTVMYAAPLPPEDNTRALAALLYTDYFYPFELAAVLLLVAIVAAIALTLRRRKGTKYAAPDLQVQAGKAGRVRLVSLSPADSIAIPAGKQKGE
ncbi:NADH-quinone oxidoreductase subunit J [Candidatus Persebacteraceae bacterium Df01]|uniref:NADH-quinone oxidoreductase subunit J n=1 Tax=Candidatus Doriopsillibacter californiensis TaxID=2970740 RepID=A0ABT7QLP3_9GAMM|nr:NADH-quinone oxidoreductase subunit J [Candidatus Persebacteraceae bacterium Df01]